MGGGAIMSSSCGGEGIKFSELEPQLCTCVLVGARTMPLFFFGILKRGHTSLLWAPRLWNRKKSTLRPGGGCPGWGSASQEDWTPFPSGQHGTAHAPFPWSAPGVGDIAPRLPASIPPATPELVGPTTRQPAVQPRRLGTSKPCAGGER